jgi:hypothetical protein
MREIQNVEKRYYNWFEELSGIKTKIIYLKETDNNIADSLSRIFTTETENINDTRTIYPSLDELSYIQKISQTIRTVKQIPKEIENWHLGRKQTYLLCIGIVNKEP